MKKTFVALCALLVGGGLAVGATAQAQVVEVVPDGTAVTADVALNNVISGALDVQSVGVIDLQVEGQISVEGKVNPVSIGQTLVDAKQLLRGNGVVLLGGPDGEPGIYDNAASLGADSFSNSAGNVGVNIAAGDNMVQDNAVAVGTVLSVDHALKADAITLQQAIENVFNGQFDSIDGEGGELLPGSANAIVTNDALIASGAFNNTSGNLGVNVAAGANIGQRNTLQVGVTTASVSNVVLASANAGVIQRSIGNISFLPTTTNIAAVGDIGINASGNIAINVASGTNILQNNSLVVTTIK